METKIKGRLTPKQELFCQTYVESGNLAAAYRKAYAAKNIKPQSIYSTSQNLLKSPKIAARVEQLQTDLRSKSDIKKDDLLRELSVVAFSDIRDYLSWDGRRLQVKPLDQLSDAQARAIESMKETRYGIDLKLHGKGWAIERISKMLGYDSPEDVNLKLEALPDEALDKIIDRILNKEKP